MREPSSRKGCHAQRPASACGRRPVAAILIADGLRRCLNWMGKSHESPALSSGEWPPALADSSPARGALGACPPRPAPGWDRLGGRAQRPPALQQNLTIRSTCCPIDTQGGCLCGLTYRPHEKPPAPPQHQGVCRTRVRCGCEGLPVRGPVRCFAHRVLMPPINR